jgi:hypothetical protein
MERNSMTVLKELFQLLLIFGVIWFLYKDSKRIFRAFFLHLERKLLIVHSIKLGVFLVLIYKFRRYIPFHDIMLIFIGVLILIFISLLTLKQVEFKKKGTINSKYKAFKYGSKLAQYLLFLLSVLMNFDELKKNKHEIKQKSKEAMYVAIFPVQKYVMVSISRLQFTRRKEKFITDEDLNEIKSRLEPGDILLKRNDWQATNLGISGFWTHTGLYIGTLKELDNYFSDVEALGGKRFSENLKEINEKIYVSLLKNSDLEVIEAIEEGVVVKPISNIAKVDYFSALRARVPKEEKMKSILKAYSFVGRPYDFYIDLETDDAFVCTAVIKKSFEDTVSLEIENKLGKKVVLPNSIAKKFAEERKKKDRILDFVLFYDLDIKTRKAYKSTEIQFAKSYKRNFAYYRKRDMLKYLATILD